MTVHHECPNCGAHIRGAMFACRNCWPRLPPNLRTAILRAWGRRRAGVATAEAEHEAAKATALRWFVEHPKKEPKTPKAKEPKT